MKILLVGINAKYCHSNLAIRYLQKYAEGFGYEVQIEEYTINQQVDHILGDIAAHQPDVLGFSCYIWNVEYVKKLVRAYKTISEKTFILLGGPEVSYESDQVLLEDFKEADGIIFGEGEKTFIETISSLKEKTSMEHIKGLVYRVSHGIVKNEARAPLSLNELPFVYESGFSDFENRIIYYETMRGCPFNCQYCLSSIEKGVRFRSLNKVKKELQFFLNHNVSQVKLVDRTFNCNKEHALAIWQYLQEHDNGVTNFHFEISADLLDDGTITFLGQAREGLFQFEIGVQSTFNPTIAAIQRKTDFNQLMQNVQRLKAGQNIHLHLDLIAGLPFEGYTAFEKSFNDVYQLRPEQLQLGFLKVLKGSGLYHDSALYGIKYRAYAPYEVLSTNELTFLELGKLKILEEMVELFYNSGQYEWTVLYLERFFDSPFSLYESLAFYWGSKGYHKLSHSKMTLITFLKEFSEEQKGLNRDFIHDLLLYDLCLKEKVKKYPEWMQPSEKYKNEMNDFYKEEGNIARYLPELKAYSSRQISRMAHIEAFDYKVTRFVETNGLEIDKKQEMVLFNYHNKDKMRHNARVYSLEIE